jgi:hypothetical protein
LLPGLKFDPDRRLDHQLSLQQQLLNLSSRTDIAVAIGRERRATGVDVSI